MNSDRLYRGLLAYALIKGAARGLRKPPRQATVLLTDAILKEHYVDVLKEALNQRPLLLSGWDHQNHLHIATGSNHWRAGEAYAVDVPVPRKLPHFFSEPVILALATMGRRFLLRALPEPPRQCSERDTYDW